MPDKRVISSLGVQLPGRRVPKPRKCENASGGATPWQPGPHAAGFAGLAGGGEESEEPPRGLLDSRFVSSRGVQLPGLRVPKLLAPTGYLALAGPVAIESVRQTIA